MADRQSSLSPARFPEAVALTEGANSTPEEMEAAHRFVRRAANRHGCTRRRMSDPPCSLPGHAADVSAAREMLVALGLVDDRYAIEVSGNGHRSARCAGCERKVRLSSNGTFYEHPRSSHLPVREDRCPGSGRPVGEAGAPAPVAVVPRPVSRPPVRRLSAGSLAWMEDAACRGESLALFFGHEGEKAAEKAAREEKAKAVCDGCWARTECLLHALSYPERSGVWAGLGEDERDAERRRWMRREADARSKAAQAEAAQVEAGAA
ncbi:WhiB family transcriptional regulator [Acrocarpospora sp. B8E8]|uniref:WhiB family transcriptional regulator n=1 Tax=Acrocarpospora sp. B8E8 TaxID=3153572 RepID=UPI00325F222C